MSNTLGTTIESLVAEFAENINEVKRPGYKEASLRLQYLDKFFRLLGWDVGGINRETGEREVEIEPSIDVPERDRLRSRRPDYLFKLTFPRFTCEAKKPVVDIDEDRDAIYQCKRDAWANNLPFAILTDFEQFRVFDAGYRADLDAPRHGLVRDLSLDFNQYVAQWDVLQAAFSRDAVAGGSLEALRAKVRRTRQNQRVRAVDRMLIEVRGDQPVSRVFLAHLQKHREHFASDIYRHNRSTFPDVETPHGGAKLSEAVQRLLDRLVFMRICEDRDVVTYGILRQLIEEANESDRSLSEMLRAQFRQFDRTFNGYLFKPHFVEELQVSASVLRDFIVEMYPPEGDWNFATMGDDLLAIVYEEFLGSTITVQRGHVGLEQKPEVRHAEGVYYTPRFVVDMILRRVVEPKVAGKSPVELLDVKLLDPACGSGSFLVRAYDFLVSRCEQAIEADPRFAYEPPLPPEGRKFVKKDHKPIAYQQTREVGVDERGLPRVEKVWRLLPDFKGRLLQGCIHGVDIDHQAVEVTIMSLYIKLLSNLPADWAGLSTNRLLPPLDNNIRCGNSLIEPEQLDEYASQQHGGLFTGSEDVQFRINAFDWGSRTGGFGRVLDAHGGFDCIIGNPPYIRVQELQRWAPEEAAFYKWAYESAERGNFDIYVVFVEKCLNGGKGRTAGLLKSDGLMGFIMPHKWWQATYGAGLRRIVSESKRLVDIVDFREEQVFEGATTYTAIHTFGTNTSDTVDVLRVNKLIDGTLLGAGEEAGRNELTRFSTPMPAAGSWEFNPPSLLSSDAIRRMPTLGVVDGAAGVARLAQGLKTSGDKVYVLRRIGSSRGEVTVHSQQTHMEHRLEMGLLRPLVKSEHMEAFAPKPTDLLLLFPYEVNEEGKHELVSIAEIEERFPLTAAYLEKVKPILAARERGRMAEREDWHAYIYPKNFAALSMPKLMIPDMCESLHVSMDTTGEFIFSGGAAGGNAIIPLGDMSLEYLCGVMNSRLLDFIKRESGTRFRGGWLNCEIRFIKNLPIKIPVSTSEKKIAGRIEATVKQVEAATSMLRQPGLGEHQKRHLERTVEAGRNRIDADVMTLYGVEGLEIPTND